MGFLQFRDDVLAKGSQEPVRLPYGYRTVHVRVRTVHVRASYGKKDVHAQLSDTGCLRV